QAIYDFAASFQYAVFRHICYKLGKVLKKHPSTGQVWLGGGVAANIKLRVMIRETLRDSNAKYQVPNYKQIQNPKLRKPKLFTPFAEKLCSDNAAMIGIAANFKYQNNDFVENLDELERKPRWRVID
ncbi:MAG: hypothetical protein ABFQ62_05565, partial [Patescibacteria group bacterium]